jgi:HNH endonuclease
MDTDNGAMRRLSTNRGIAAAAITTLVTIAVAAGSRNPAGTLLGLVILSPLGWWFWWAVLGALRTGRAGLVRGRPPDVRVGRQWLSADSTRPQLRQDANARVFADRGGILLRKRRWFVASGTPPFEIPDDRWSEIATAQLHEPQSLGTWRDRTFWWYRNEFYWSTAGAYASADVKALLYARQRRNTRALEHAHAVLAASTSAAPRRRERIPRDVRVAVWERDKGRCVECESDFELQYDHVIPFSMGGASTVENLQLLCARCNQAKGGQL